MDESKNETMYNGIRLGELLPEFFEELNRRMEKNRNKVETVNINIAEEFKKLIGRTR